MKVEKTGCDVSSQAVCALNCSAARKERQRKNELLAAWSRVRQSYGRFLSELVNRRYAELLGGQFCVSVYGKLGDDFGSLTRLHWDMKVFFCPASDVYAGLMEPVEPLPGMIDVQEAELNKRYVELAAANRWKLTHEVIVKVLEILDEEGLAQIDALMCEVDASLGGDEPGPTALLAICSFVAVRIESM